MPLTEVQDYHNTLCTLVRKDVDEHETDTIQHYT